MRGATEPAYVTRINEKRDDDMERKKAVRRRLIRRVWVHIGVFLLSFVFTAGVAVLSILLWVRADDALLPFILTGVLSAGVFVIAFIALRLFVLHHLLYDYPNKEEDPGFRYHLTKSIAYGFVALVVAVILTGLIINIASASLAATSA